MRLRQGGASAVITLLLLVALFLVCFLSRAGAARADVLREIESLWSAALEEHGAILFIVRPDTGEIVRANAAAARFYGYSREQLESFVMQDLNLYSREKINQEREKAAQKGLHYITVPQRLADGEIRMVGLQSFPLFSDESGFMLCMFSDVTEELFTRSELEKSVERLKRAETIASIGAWEFHLDQGRVLLSEGAQRILGWPGPEQTLQDTYDNTLPEYRKLREDALRGLVEQGQSYDIRFKLWRATDGEVIDIHSIGKYDEETNIVFGTFQDISEFLAKDAAMAALRKRHMDLLLVFASVQLAVIVLLLFLNRQRRKAEQAVRQNLKRNESLVRILQHPAESMEDLLDYALHESITLTGSSIGYIYLYDEKTKQFTLNTWSRGVMDQCEIKDPQDVYDLEKTGIWGEAVRRRRPLIVNDFQAPHPSKKGYPRGHAPLLKYLTVPVFDQERIVAVVGLANKKADYDDMDVWQVALLMNNVWMMVERRRSDRALLGEKERLGATLLSVSEGVIATDRLGRIEMINKAAEELTGWEERDALGRPFQEIYVLKAENGAADPHSDPITLALETGRRVQPENTRVLVTRSGRKLDIADSAAPIRNAHGEITGAVLVFRDVSAERKRLAEIEYLSRHDHLTGVHNRRYFDEKLKELDTPGNLPISIAIADVDGLKIVNDTFGHEAGDQVLRMATSVMRRCSRAGDIAARWGGDEFVLLLPKTDLEEVRLLAESIEEVFMRETMQSFPLSISLGWQTKTEAGESLADVFKEAENHMYRAKLLQSPGIRSEMIHALMAALYEKNPREEQHCKRVSRLSQSLGQALGLTERDVKELEIIGLFHDIGKVSIPESILNKAGELTDHDWEQIRRHPEVGYRVLSNVHDMADIAEYVLAHHERWDGTGYPRGLIGEATPLQSRIIAVADAYDAMLSYRPYRSSLTQAEAVAELKRCAGTQFDPYIVDVFLRMLEESPGEAAATGE